MEPLSSFLLAHRQRNIQIQKYMKNKCSRWRTKKAIYRYTHAKKLKECINSCTSPAQVLHRHGCNTAERTVVANAWERYVPVSRGESRQFRRRERATNVYTSNNLCTSTNTNRSLAWKSSENMSMVCRVETPHST